jgi:type IV secretory pathway TrbF-like protein
MEPTGDTPPATDWSSPLKFDSTHHGEVRWFQDAYHEIQRRDGAAWWHAANWRKVALVLLAVVLVLLSVILYMAFQQSQVQAFVQTVQLTDDNRLVQVGIPVDLLSYTPQDGEWRNMLVRWVQNYRWRVDETLSKHNWAWNTRHTCGGARAQLQADETRLNPFNPDKRISVIIKTVTKTETPSSWQVVWEEVNASKGVAGGGKPESHTGTFTVGRIRPKKMAELLDNSLGQCVNGYNIFPPVTN